MPLYEYLCDACGHRFEKIQKFSDPLVAECPKCGGAVHKLMSSPAIQFKGSGFYITDYAKKDHVAAAKADSASNNGSGSSSKESTATEGAKSDTPAPPASSSSSDSSSSSSSSDASPSKPAAKPTTSKT
jgi:putative FmdB family regulatory protein